MRKKVIVKEDRYVCPTFKLTFDGAPFDLKIKYAPEKPYLDPYIDPYPSASEIQLGDHVVGSIKLVIDEVPGTTGYVVWGRQGPTWLPTVEGQQNVKS